MMKKLWMTLVAVIMFTVSGLCADPPEGWEQGYMMSGRFEYCFTEVPASEGTLEVDMAQSELTVIFGPKATLKAPVSMTFGGVVYKGVANDYSNSWTFNLPAGRELDAALAEIAKGTSKVIITHPGGTIEVPFDNVAAKNIAKAYKWIMDNPAGLL